MLDSVTWKIGGEAGFGIMSAGTMLGRTVARLGYHVFVTNEYPSLIRGGHNVITARVSAKEFHGLNRDLHILTALNKATIELHKHEVSQNALIVFDPADIELKAADFSKPVRLLPIPLTKLVADLHGEQIMRNTLALSATVALIGAPFESLASVIADQFKKKGKEVMGSNLKVAQTGYDYVKNNFKDEISMYLTPAAQKERQLVINGSEALGVAAVRAGLKFAAIYPMTPINSVITFLADHAKDLQLVYKQPEDEIAGINMAIGASFSGVRSMVATSGGGFALMVEGVSLAGMLEVPLVVDMGMRPGPATGMPTWTEQGELQFVIHAGHGEFARIVLAPGDAGECFDLTIEAFNLADRFQTPVIILMDKYLNESQWCVSEEVFKKPVTIDRGKLILSGALPQLGPDESYKRFSLDTADGVSARTVPGVKNGQFFANSYEHDETGHVTEDAHKRTAMADKRLKKFVGIGNIAKPPTLYGPKGADITIVGWGSTKGPILDALSTVNFQLSTRKVNFLHFTWLYPFSPKATEMLKECKRIVDIENNGTGQLASLIREHTSIEITEKLLQYDGRPFYPEEILEKLTLLK